MPRYEGPADVRSTLEDERRNPRRPQIFNGLFAIVILALVAAVPVALFVVPLIDASGYHTTIKGTVVGTSDLPPKCSVLLDGQPLKDTPQVLTPKTDAAFAQCKQYVGKRVVFTLDVSEVNISDVKPAK